MWIFPVLIIFFMALILIATLQKRDEAMILIPVIGVLLVMWGFANMFYEGEILKEAVKKGYLIEEPNGLGRSYKWADEVHP